MQVRAEPDGAFSSYTASPLPASKFEDLFKAPESRQVDTKMKPSATQELSEFRQPQREYKDYREIWSTPKILIIKNIQRFIHKLPAICRKLTVSLNINARFWTQTPKTSESSKHQIQYFFFSDEADIVSNYWTNLKLFLDNKNKEGNYRKDFACGVKSSMSCGSTYSEESQNISQVYHSKYGSITRYYSVLPYFRLQTSWYKYFFRF